MPDPQLGRRIGEALVTGLAGPLVGPLIGRAIGSGYDAPTPIPNATPDDDAVPTPIPTDELDGEALGEGLTGTPSEIVNALLQAAWQELSSAKDPVERAALAEEAKSLLEASIKLSERKNGLLRVDDTTILSQAELDAMGPAERAQLEAIAQNYGAKLDNEYAAIANKYGLAKYDAQRDAQKDRNATATQDFQNALAEADQGLAYDTFDLNQAVRNVERSISGLGESRARAQYVTNTQLAAAPYGTTGGKTSFTARDLGAGAAKLAATGGINPDEVFANFGGTTLVDPQGQIASGDAALGVEGPLPTLPGRTENRRPTRPNLLSPDAVFPELTPPTRGVNPYQGLMPKAVYGTGPKPAGATDYAPTTLQPDNIPYNQRGYQNPFETGGQQYPLGYGDNGGLLAYLQDLGRKGLAGLVKASTAPGGGVGGIATR